MRIIDPISRNPKGDGGTFSCDMKVLDSRRPCVFNDFLAGQVGRQVSDLYGALANSVASSIRGFIG